MDYLTLYLSGSMGHPLNIPFDSVFPAESHVVRLAEDLVQFERGLKQLAGFFPLGRANEHSEISRWST